MPEKQLQTRRGKAIEVSYQNWSRSGTTAVEHRSAANQLVFKLEREVIYLRDEGELPFVSEGDDVEVSGTFQDRTNAFGATVLINHTTGGNWQFSVLRAAGRGAAAGCLGNALSTLGMLLLSLALAVWH